MSSDDKPKQEPEKSEIQNQLPARLVTQDDSEFNTLLDTAKFDQMYRVAKIFAASDLVPKQYKGKPADSFIAIQMSLRLGVDPMMVMQNTYVVHGTPGMEGKLVIALINKNGPFDAPVQWKFEGQGKMRKCTAYGNLVKGGGVCEAVVDWKMVEDEGWDKNSKWKTMPDLMFRYRSASFLGRLYCPEVLMGMQTVDEIIDVKGKPVAFSDAQAEAEADIKQESGSQEIDAKFEDQTPAETEPESQETEKPEDNEDWADLANG
ncbi:hypothetical protein KAR91_85605 [Candidatus Pacearchaeota archaeon]|nr:hypothetical protein [Candidatus Pacearchaeota archaeon]